MRKFNVKYGNRFVTLNPIEMNNLIEEHEKAGTELPDYDEIAECKDCVHAVWDVRPGEHPFCSNSAKSKNRDIHYGWKICRVWERKVELPA